jgi:DNA helicase-2/ATP-dependent DNA helicase PcrA
MIALNNAQKAAVTAPDGPALVLAGAGSGKTRVIIERLAWLVDERGVDPRRLLALTFTNRAAAEMRERLATRLRMAKTEAWLGTFHSFGLYLLRREIEHLGRKRAFTVFDDGDQMSLMRRLVRDLPEHRDAVRPREALAWISRLKQEVNAPDFSTAPLENDEETYRHLWTAYHAALARASALDFDDLLVLMVKLLQDHPEVRARYQRRYQYILVDEYQDTNRAQYLAARLLSEAHGNLFVVGDEDQSIYSWRGADINNILDFAKDFPTAKVFRLEENYRSTKPILEAANRLVAHNLNRLGKTLRTANEGGDPVEFRLAEDGLEEAQGVVADIAQRALDLRSAAVLYRTNAQSRLIEEACLKTGTPYRVVGGIKFYARKEIKDLLCYLRLLVNPDDDESLRRVLNVPPRGIGATTMALFEDYAKRRQCTLLQVLRDTETDETLPPRARVAATAFVALIDDLALAAKSGPVRPLVVSVLEQTGYDAYIENSDEKDFRSRLDNVEEFIASCESYDRSEGRPLADYLQEQSLLSDADEYRPGDAALTLMTCHSAKGLEFDYVYLIGLEEGLFPFARGADADFEDAADIEEERRLCYVAMTRARKGLTLSAARKRAVYGREDMRQVSCFVKEAGLAVSKPQPQAAPLAEKVTGDILDRIKTGTRLRHTKFGMGTVMYTRGTGVAMKARIRFDSGRSVLLLMRMAPIEIVEGRLR